MQWIRVWVSAGVGLDAVEFKTIFIPGGIKTPAVNPVANLYTDYTTILTNILVFVSE